MAEGKIVLRDVANKEASISMVGIASPDDIDTIANVVLNYTHAVQSKRVFTEPYNIGTKALDGAYCAVEDKAELHFRNLDLTERKRQPFTFKLPAPVASMFELVANKGYRVTKAVGDEIATKIGTAIGANVRFEYGVLHARRLTKKV